ncbi:hypothetical protein [Parasitella parasitica]|uniref:Uncharacterized protein n=1 Tax=Parasitella parasitica TaxID=35722 RepID=A0A0B7N916_9FUNG|nr:hypothetical protein [Parasitella parasitica]
MLIKKGDHEQVARDGTPPQGRFRVDYRKLNAITVKKDKLRIGNLNELLDQIHDCKYLSTVDLKAGYWQIALDLRGYHKTAFIAYGALYRSRVLPFGCRCKVYLDDLIVFGPSLEDQEKVLSAVLKRIEEYNLKISNSLSAIKESDTNQRKYRLITVTLQTLAYADSSKPYDVNTNSSMHELGAVIVQNGRPVAFASRTLTPAKKNYSTTEQGALCVVYALKHFYIYFYGASLTIYTDHASLKSILLIKKPKERIARKGALNVDGDALNRRDKIKHSQDIQAGKVNEAPSQRGNGGVRTA